MESIKRTLEMSEALQRKAMLQKIDGILKKYN
jgi:hypothetical protein